MDTPWVLDRTRSNCQSKGICAPPGLSGRHHRSPEAVQRGTFAEGHELGCGPACAGRRVSLWLEELAIDPTLREHQWGAAA